MDMPPDRGGSVIDMREALDVRGMPLAGGSAFTVDVTTAQGTDHIIVAARDMDRLISLLLLLGMPRAQVGDRDISDMPVIPASSLSVGELPNGDALLVVDVGAARLGFSLPPRAATAVGQSLLMAGLGESQSPRI